MLLETFKQPGLQYHLYSKERPKGKGEEMVKLVAFLKVCFQFCFKHDSTSQQVLFNVESCPSTCLEKLLQDKECVLLLRKQTSIAALITCGQNPQLGRWRAGAQPNFVLCGEQTAFRLAFLSVNILALLCCPHTRKFKSICHSR